mgnify:CR=1 FL=1
MFISKTQAIQEFEKDGYTYEGYKETCWGEKQYFFTHPNIHGEVSYCLEMLRKKARSLEMMRWHKEFRAELEYGIQQTLFCDWEIEEMSLV